MYQNYVSKGKKDRNYFKQQEVMRIGFMRGVMEE